jgi:hypothetical protein
MDSSYPRLFMMLGPLKCLQLAKRRYHKFKNGDRIDAPPVQDKKWELRPTAKRDYDPGCPRRIVAFRLTGS